MIAYVLQMISFIRLRWLFPYIPRPYVSPLGVFGAVLASAIALVTLVMLFLNRDYNLGVIGAAVWFLLGIAYFALHGRRQLVLAPEEEFAQGVRTRI